LLKGGRKGQRGCAGFPKKKAKPIIRPWNGKKGKCEGANTGLKTMKTHGATPFGAGKGGGVTRNENRKDGARVRKEQGQSWGTKLKSNARARVGKKKGEQGGEQTRSSVSHREKKKQEAVEGLGAQGTWKSRYGLCMGFLKRGGEEGREML